MLYDKKRGICKLESEQDFQESKNIQKDILLYVELDFDTDPSFWIEKGFSHPLIQKDKLVLTKFNGEKTDRIQTENSIDYVISEYMSNNNYCSLKAKFDRNAIKFLKKICKLGINREVAGEMMIANSIKTNIGILYIIGVNEQSIVHGTEENVDVSMSRFNFHCHPEEAYIRHSVHKAWPSLTDFLGLLKLGKNTIFHVVATLEGVYIMSFSEYWGKHPEKIDKNFVKKQFHIDHSEKISPKEYTEIVNRILYRNHPIFHIIFLDWSEIDQEFVVKYGNGEKGEKGGCMYSDTVVERGKKLR